MFRRVIAAILFFSVLGYGTAWAFEWHSVDIADHARATEHADAGPQVDDEACDHCCHATTHLIGLRYIAGQAVPYCIAVTFPAYAFSSISFVTDPPTRPPKA
ncbi:MAG: hypothetical protein WAN46_16000 [Gammaproteobacteria bacterium]|jgi:hypothetical protein